MEEMERKELLKNFDRFAGGRSLTAIYECDNLTEKEQTVMLYLGHCAGFATNGYVNLKSHKLETVAKKVRCSIDTARRSLKTLAQKGYISRVRRLAANGMELTPEYAMTHKIFDEYEQKWLEKETHEKKVNDLWGSKMLGGGSTLLGGGSNTPPLIIPPLNSSPSFDFQEEEEIQNKTPLPPYAEETTQDKKPGVVNVEAERLRERIVGRLQSVYGRHAQRAVMEALADELLEIAQPGLIIQAINLRWQMQKPANGLNYFWHNDHFQVWKDYLREQMHGATDSEECGQPGWYQ